MYKWILKLLGLLLLVAAILKGWQLATTPVANDSIWTSRWFLILLTQLEFAWSIWLLSGLFSVLAWKITAVGFAIFTVVTFYNAITGAGSCGCFGNVHINPWITLLAIDIPVLVLLLFFRPQKGGGAGRGFDLKKFNLACFVFLAVCIPSTYAMVTFKATTVSQDGEIVGESDNVLLEPETWVGNPLPILKYIDIKDHLAVSNWVVTLFHHDCPKCQETLPVYQEMANEFAGNDDVFQFAFIELPPYGDYDVSIESDAKYGKISDEKEWLVTTPSLLFLREGEVVSTWKEDSLPSLDDFLDHIE